MAKRSSRYYNLPVKVLLSLACFFLLPAQANDTPENVNAGQSANADLAASFSQAELAGQAGLTAEQESAYLVILEQTELSGNLAAKAIALNNLGNLKAARRQYAAALNHYQQSAEIAAHGDEEELAALATLNAARINLIQGQDILAFNLLKSVAAQLLAQPENTQTARLLLGTGRLIQLAEQDKLGVENGTELAYQVLAKGLQYAEKLDAVELRGYGYGYLGALYLAQARLDEARELTRRAEFFAQAAGRPNILYRWQWQTARILIKQHATADAINAYRQAVATLTPLRSQLHLATLANPLTESTEKLYLELADLLLQSDKLSSEELLTVRDLIEESRKVELENFYHDDCISAWLNKSTKIDKLNVKTAALYPILFPDRLELLLSLPQGLQQYTVPANQTKVLDLIRQMRQNLENRSSMAFAPNAKALYDLLIRPLAADLENAKVDTLVFVPDAAFRNIPLAALHDGNEFIIRKYAVATSPGLTLTDPQPLPSGENPTLLAGLSENNLGFTPLPNVKTEIAGIAAQYPSTILEDNDFRQDSIRQLLLEHPYRMVHVASHGQFSANAQETFILAADGKISLDQLGDMLGVNRYRDKPVELLTLSACQTAAGDDKAALGLAGIAVKAGVRSTLASLWFINDTASEELMIQFYRQLKNSGASKAKALRQAQLDLLDGERFEHPGYWAPFLIIGNWL